MSNLISVEYVQHMGNDVSVVNAARVSFNKEIETLTDKDIQLLNYLARHGHWTPFSHTSITVRVTAPVSIRTQCFKHKQGFVENEVSRRYVTSLPVNYVPSKWRKAPVNKKQGSSGIFEEVVTEYDDGTFDRFPTDDYQMVCDLALEVYADMIDRGIAPEQARFVLPQGMMTQWFWTGNVASFARFYQLRAALDAQYEVRLVAEQVWDIMEKLFPYSWMALTEPTEKER